MVKLVSTLPRLNLFLLGKQFWVVLRPLTEERVQLPHVVHALFAVLLVFAASFVVKRR
jgi:hypothetical protein